MFKKHFLILGLLVVILIAVIILVISFKHQKEEVKISTEEINVSNDPYIERAIEYSFEGRYGEGILEAKKAIEIDPSDPRGYNCLVGNYAGQRKYSEAITASKKQLEILEAKGLFDVNIVSRHAALLEVSISHDRAIEFLESYREKFPRTIDIDVEGLRKAKREGTLYYPYFRISR